MEENKHSLTINNRENFEASGITDVLSYDDETIVADSQKGILIVRGNGLHILSLDLQRGNLSAEGNITSLSYDNNTNRSSIWSKLFKWYCHLHINLNFSWVQSALA